MEGMGKIKEKIIEINHQNKTLKYSAIETRTPIDHHLACMQLIAISDSSTELLWSTEIEPEIFAEAIHQGMLVSAEGLKKVRPFGKIKPLKDGVKQNKGDWKKKAKSNNTETKKSKFAWIKKLNIFKKSESQKKEEKNN